MATKYNHTINDVPFSIEDNARKTFPKLSHSSSDAESGIFEKIINAVEIDWNGVDWSSIPTGQETPSEINTTADLLKQLNMLHNKVKETKYVETKDITNHSCAVGDSRWSNGTDAERSFR